MLHDCRYNEIKILHELSKLVWFIKNHCTDEKYVCHQENIKTLNELKKTLEKYIEEIDQKL